MPSISDFPKDARVFILHSADEWIGVEVIAYFPNLCESLVEIVWTNDIPGVVRGERITLDENIVAHEHLTVDTAMGTDRAIDILRDRAAELGKRDGYRAGKGAVIDYAEMAEALHDGITRGDPDIAEHLPKLGAGWEARLQTALKVSTLDPAVAMAYALVWQDALEAEVAARAEKYLNKSGSKQE